MSITMLVAAHKAYRLPQDPMYLPIQVGKAISPLDLGIQGDDTGDSISEKNPYYCELTALYWAWKNLDCNYIGLSHYRRYFALKKQGDKWDRILTGAEAARLLRDTQVVLPKKRHYYIETVYSQYIHAHPAEPLDLALKLAAQTGPSYASAVAHLKKRTWTHLYNMFLMEKSVFDGYCSWLFPLLGQIEAEIDLSGYSRNDQRVFGFLSERLLDIYLEAQGISYQEAPVLFMENQNWLRKGSAFLRRKFSGGS